MQRAPLRLSNDYNNLLTSELTSNQVVGSSNLSGRANLGKKLNRLAVVELFFLRIYCPFVPFSVAQLDLRDTGTDTLSIV